jgi:hypothetical protein
MNLDDRISYKCLKYSIFKKFDDYGCFKYFIIHINMNILWKLVLNMNFFVKLSKKINCLFLGETGISLIRKE